MRTTEDLKRDGWRCEADVNRETGDVTYIVWRRDHGGIHRDIAARASTASAAWAAARRVVAP